MQPQCGHPSAQVAVSALGCYGFQRIWPCLILMDWPQGWRHQGQKEGNGDEPLCGISFLKKEEEPPAAGSRQELET